MVTPKQGDIFWVEAEDQRRPGLVVTRDQAIPVLNRVSIAPVTRSIRGIPTEVGLGQKQGLTEPSVASFDNIEVIPKVLLTKKIGALATPRMQIRRALEALADC